MQLPDDQEIDEFVLKQFARWAEQVGDFYPDLCVQPKNDQYILDAFWSVVSECFTCAEMQGADEDKVKFGFFMGYVSSRLSTRFYTDLVGVHSDLYKTVVAMSALQKYIQQNPEISDELNRVYESVLDREGKVVEMSSSICRNFLGYTPRLGRDMQDRVLTAVMNTKDEMIAKFVAMESPVAFSFESGVEMVVIYRAIQTKADLGLLE